MIRNILFCSPKSGSTISSSSSESGPGSPFVSLSPSQWKYTTPQKSTLTKRGYISPDDVLETPTSSSLSKLNLVFSDAEPGSPIKEKDHKKACRRLTHEPTLKPLAQPLPQHISGLPTKRQRRVVAVAFEGHIRRFRIVKLPPSKPKHHGQPKCCWPKSS